MRILQVPTREEQLRCRAAKMEFPYHRIVRLSLTSCDVFIGAEHARVYDGCVTICRAPRRDRVVDRRWTPVPGELSSLG